MTRHIHRWAGAGFTSLSLPDTQGNFEALKFWRCFACGAEGTAIGTLDAQPCTLTPAQWDALVDQQRRNLAPDAQAMARQWRLVERGQRRL